TTESGVCPRYSGRTFTMSSQPRQLPHPGRHGPVPVADRFVTCAESTRPARTQSSLRSDHSRPTRPVRVWVAYRRGTTYDSDVRGPSERKSPPMSREVAEFVTSVEADGPVPVAVFRGELDLAVADRAWECLRSLI